MILATADSSGGAYLHHELETALWGILISGAVFVMCRPIEKRFSLFPPEIIWLGLAMLLRLAASLTEEGLLLHDVVLHVADSAAVWVIAMLALPLFGFEAGLGMNLPILKRTLLPSTAVALPGVVLPFVGCFALTVIWLEGFATGSDYLLSFVGAAEAPEIAADTSKNALAVAIASCATSVAMMLAAMKRAGKLTALEGQVGMGAGVIDDVMAIVLLGVAVASFEGGDIADAAVNQTLSGGGFMIGAILLGLAGRRFYFGWMSRHEMRGHLWTTMIIAGAFFSLAAMKFGLEPLLGGFALGVVVDAKCINTIRPCKLEGPEAANGNPEHRVHQELKRLERFLSPFFYVWVGLQADLTTLANWESLSFAGALIVVSYLGKYFAGLGALPFTRGELNWRGLGHAMAARGEVGYAVTGLAAPFLPPWIVSALIAMIVVNTVIGPILASRAFNKRS